MVWFNICQKLSDEIYKDNVNELIDGWETVRTTEIVHMKNKKGDSNIHQKKNFSAVAYKKGNEIIIAFRGTDDKKDIIEDVRIAFSKGLKGDKFAHQYTEDIISMYPDCNITFTGHSLGGAYAQLACVKKLIEGNNKCKALTFNAPGMSKYLRKKTYKGTFDKSKIENYVIMNDFIGNYREHIGHTYYFQPFPMDVSCGGDNYETPHGCIRHMSREQLGGVISKEYLKDFSSKHGLALWCWDTKNITDKKYIRILKKPLRIHHLTEAVRIIKKCSKIKLLHSFTYKSRKVVIDLP